MTPDKFIPGRKHAPDARDKNFLMAAPLHQFAEVIDRPVKKTYRLWWKGDQGQTSQCVGYAWHALLRALPMLQRQPEADVIYRAAQTLDEWPGEDYDGTSVRGGAKYLLQEGRIKFYRWALNVADIVGWLAFRGPVVLGTEWTYTMFYPDKTGLVKVGSLTNSVGGHAFVAIGFDDIERRIICQNSWGKTWGVKGRFSISYDDMAVLLTAGGEACAPSEV